MEITRPGAERSGVFKTKKKKTHTHSHTHTQLERLDLNFYPNRDLSAGNKDESLSRREVSIVSIRIGSGGREGERDGIKNIRLLPRPGHQLVWKRQIKLLPTNSLCTDLHRRIFELSRRRKPHLNAGKRTLPARMRLKKNNKRQENCL